MKKKLFAAGAAVALLLTGTPAHALGSSALSSSTNSLNPEYVLKWGVTTAEDIQQCRARFYAVHTDVVFLDYKEDDPDTPCPNTPITQQDVDAANREVAFKHLFQLLQVGSSDPVAAPRLNPHYILKWGVTDKDQSDQCWAEYFKTPRTAPEYPVAAVDLLPDDSLQLPCPRAQVTQEDVDQARAYLGTTFSGTNTLASILNVLGGFFAWLKFHLSNLF